VGKTIFAKKCSQSSQVFSRSSVEEFSDGRNGSFSGKVFLPIRSSETEKKTINRSKMLCDSCHFLMTTTLLFLPILLRFSFFLLQLSFALIYLHGQPFFYVLATSECRKRHLLVFLRLKKNLPSYIAIPGLSP